MNSAIEGMLPNFNVSETLQLVVIIYLSVAVFVPLIWNDGPPWRDRSRTMPPKKKPGLGQGILEQWNIGNKRPKRIISNLS